MSSPPSMQEVIARLNDFWSKNPPGRSCMIWQPYSEKVGAGTMNPATALRVLGPEPWNVAYMEPSFRADDGRYAENPNRMQMHNQYQVILKPDPGNPQELYLASLEAIGLDRTRHDIRFVEDNWESPALGAWGLGWEVWLDGQEITQFTYFQQSGSMQLDPVSVEITYGLDRIVMYLQNKRDVWSIDVDGVHTYGEIYAQPEIEHCVYNFELADVERLKRLYEIYELEAQACIERGLALPAYDFVLRQSHTFNLLDSRGAVGVTERAKFFAGMRGQTRAISELYVQQRQHEEYPWLEDSDLDGRSSAAAAQPAVTVATDFADTTQDFVLELGSEELPPHDVVHGIEQIHEALTELLDRNQLSYTDLRVTGTTRRLVAYVRGLAPRQADEVSEKRGPSADRAFDGDGKPTKAASGFARGQGVNVADLEVRDGYVFATRRTVGRPTLEVLPAICIDLLDGLRWAKAMRWNSSGVSYPRPLRWIVALLGDMIVPFSWADVASGRVSRGPRYADAAANLEAGAFTTFEIDSSSHYFDVAGAQQIVIDRAERRRAIHDLVQKTAARVGGHTPDDDDLLDEVTDLVEVPLALLGEFQEEHLQLPEPILIAVMKKHQRYFPVLREASDGETRLLPFFVTVANSSGLASPEVVKEGNEGVIRARYADAAYFYRQDTQLALAEFTPRLKTLTFHEKLGSMYDKVERLKVLAPSLSQSLAASTEQLAAVERAAALCKSDLVTSMVIEMTSLQGIMGEIYARVSGESAAVGETIREHYLPRSAGDVNPESLPGLALSLADKLDSLTGLFAVGAIPTGSTDPFGLRRAALGIVNNLTATDTDFSIRSGLEQAAQLQPVEVSATSLAETEAFVQRRLQGVLLEMGYAFDVVDAVLTVRGDNPNAALRACKSLSEMVASPGWEQTFTAYARCARITRNLDETFPLNATAYQGEVEHRLHAAFSASQQVLDAAPEPAAALGAQLRGQEGPINEYFDQVLVNADDEDLRSARLALVQGVAQLPAAVADLSKLQGF